MDYNQILTTLGITQGKLETIIIFTVIAIGIGIIAVLYWKFLLAGFFALVIIFVFSRHEPDIEVIAKPAPIPTVIEDPKTVVEVKPEPVKPQPLKPEPVIVESKQISKAEQEFMEDCLSLADKKSICEDLWKQRQQ
jgi:hypothetical protein